MDSLHANLDLARRVDGAEIGFCAVAGAQGGRLDELEVGGGRALFGHPGSPLNKVLGLGLHGPVSDADLDRLEAFYQERRSAAQVELNPLAASDLAARLQARGFVIQGFENELGLALHPGAGARLALPPGVEVTRARTDEDGLWVRLVSEGFAAFEPHVGGGPVPEAPPAADLEGVMSSFVHPSIRRWLARIEGVPAGGVAAWDHEGVVGIFGSATAPAFRRRGVQTALTVAILREAGAADLAIATTAPGSTSQRTFERLGFRVLYTRTILVKG